MELVSVLMSVYNEPIDYIEKSVNSILRQTYRNFEFIIVVDNPSNDFLCEYLKRIEVEHDNVHIEINDKNMGLVKSLNKGLSFCNGRYIARMDADDISDKNRIEEQVFFLKKHDYDLVASDIILFSEESERYVKFPELDPECKKKMIHSNCLPHPAWLGKKEVFSSLNGYRDIATCEDYDFLLRAMDRGYKFGNVSKGLLKYRLNPKGISRENKIKQNVIFRYLASNYRKQGIVTINDYNNFMNSNDYKEWLRQEKSLDYKKQAIIDEKRTVVKLVKKLLYVTDKMYLYKKFILKI